MLTKEQIIGDILKNEGGYVDHRDDRGGPTNFGITLKTYQRYKKGATKQDLSIMPKEVAYSIYEDVYYRRTGIEKINAVSGMIAAEVLDTAVNMGPPVAIQFLQKSLNALNNKEQFYSNVDVDGIIGNATLQALGMYLERRGQVGETVLLKALNCLQAVRYIDLALARKANESFLFGWLNTRVKL